MKVHFSNTSFGKHRLNKIKAAAHLTKTELAEVQFDEKSGIIKNLVCYTLPVLETAEGVLSSSNAIIRYLANVSNSHYGANAHEKALVDQWIDIIGYDLEPAVLSVLTAASGKDVDAKKTLEDIHKFLNFVNTHLTGKKFLVGENLTIADVSLLSNLTPVFAHVLGAEQRKTLGTLTHWYSANLPHFAAHLGEPKLVEHAHAAFAAVPATAPAAPAPAAPAAEAKKAAPKPAADDDIDLFGDDSAEKPAAVKPVVKAEPKKKKVVVAKSIVVFDVKVFEQEEDLEKLAQKIYSEVVIDGLVWNREHKILPIAYGMNRLQMACVIEDDKVTTDDIFGKIEAWEDTVQSTDVVSFQKV